MALEESLEYGGSMDLVDSIEEPIVRLGFKLPWILVIQPDESVDGGVVWAVYSQGKSTRPFYQGSAPTVDRARIEAREAVVR